MEDSSVKKPKMDRPVPTYMQNCVYPSGSAQNVSPVQHNTGTTYYNGHGNTSLDYDAPFASVLPWFDSIVAKYNATS